MTAVIETSGLGKRYGRRWALADCTLAVPAGRVVGLVGPNGAGKTTLLQLAAGLLTPDAGTIRVLGERPAGTPAQLARVGFVAQDAPVYAGLSVAGHLRMGAWLNPGWDSELAERRIGQLGLDPRQRAGSLSGGQRAQLALTLAVAKRPELLLLDEPVASLDPLARREFLQGLMEIVAEQGVSVVLSSHLIADLERVCDYLVVLVASRVRLAGETERAAGVAPPPLRTAPRRPRAAGQLEVIEESHTDKQSMLLVRTRGPDPRPGLDRPAGQPGGPGPRLHEPVGRRHARPPARTGGRVMIRFTWLQFRTQALVALGVLAVIAVVLVVTGIPLAHAYDTAVATCGQRDDCAAVLSSIPSAQGRHTAGPAQCRSSSPSLASSACSGGRRWPPASSRPARSAWPGLRASPAPAG